MSEQTQDRPKIDYSGTCGAYKCSKCLGFAKSEPIAGYVYCVCGHTEQVHKAKEPVAAQSPTDPQSSESPAETPVVTQSDPA